MLDAVTRPVLRPLRHGAYRAQQASLRYPILAAHTALRGITGGGEAAGPEDVRALQREYERLLERDLRNVDEGLYPASLLFQMPLRGYATRLPRWLLDLPRVVLRARQGNHKDIPEDVDRERFPAYFRRTFHWQTDGYLSRRSAELYDLSVEILFLGCADVMRRQVIPPIVRHAQGRRRPLRILDVACGTGRTLAQIAQALPGQQYFGVDLSPYYLESAREALAKVPEVTLCAERAEKLPFRDDYFDAVTSTYLFHELPRRQRGEALAEMARVLAPGGVLVIEDSAQESEAADLAYFLDRFSKDVHEPFYADYVGDPLEERVAELGPKVESTERTWLAKVVTAHAPKRE